MNKGVSQAEPSTMHFATLPPITPGFFNLAALPTLLGTDAPTIFEVGCHNGYHTNLFLQLFRRGRLFAFEPDQRAQQSFRQNVADPRAVLFHVAVGAHDGTATFHKSAGQNPAFPATQPWGWDHSGSIRKPTGHLKHHPWCTFPVSETVRMRTLDTLVEELGVDTIDFLWADVQGAEEDLISGGRKALSRTRYIHTEYSDVELYEGQKGLAALLELLPGFRVLARWDNDVLLWNTAFPAPPFTQSLRAARTLPEGPKVLVRPRTGLNDTLCEIEKCLRYCEANKRHLVVDTTRSGLFDHLDVYLQPRTSLPITLRCSTMDLEQLNELATVPKCVAGRLDTYGSCFSPNATNWIEEASGDLITFDFGSAYAEPLLVHEQHWTGPLLSPAFLSRCRFTDQAAVDISRRLAQRPAERYAAVHVRNTDYTTNYVPFFEKIRDLVAGMPVLVCSDDPAVFDYAKRALPGCNVFRLATFSNDTRQPLHREQRDDQYDLNIQTFTDLLGLALAEQLFSTSVREIPSLSGFAKLAHSLRQNQQIVQSLFSK